MLTAISKYSIIDHLPVRLGRVIARNSCCQGSWLCGGPWPHSASLNVSGMHVSDIYHTLDWNSVLSGILEASFFRELTCWNQIIFARGWYCGRSHTNPSIYEENVSGIGVEGRELEFGFTRERKKRKDKNCKLYRDAQKVRGQLMSGGSTRMTLQWTSYQLYLHPPEVLAHAYCCGCC